MLLSRTRFANFSITLGISKSSRVLLSFFGQASAETVKNFNDFAKLRVIERVAYNFKTLAQNNQASNFKVENLLNIDSKELLFALFDLEYKSKVSLSSLYQKLSAIVLL